MRFPAGSAFSGKDKSFLCITRLHLKHGGMNGQIVLLHADCIVKGLQHILEIAYMMHTRGSADQSNGDLIRFIVIVAGLILCGG